MKELLKELKELEERHGIKAWNDICDYIYTLIRKIEDLTESREKWKKKYMDLKDRVGD